MRERALAIRAEGPVRPVQSLRDFEPRDQVHARLQLSSGGLLRKSVAGIDVRLPQNSRAASLADGKIDILVEPDDLSKLLLERQIRRPAG